MDAGSSASTEVLIVGAGPAGLTAAVAMAAAGRSVRILDGREVVAQTSRAAVVHARTLEVLADLGIADALIRDGLVLDTFVFRTRRGPLIELDFSALPTRYPMVLFLSQAHTERALRARLAGLGVEVERPATAVSVRQSASGVEVELADGRVLRSLYLVGADGMNSVVRTLAGIDFPLVGGRAGTDATSFVLADVVVDGNGPARLPSLSAGTEGLLVTIPLPGGQYRVVAEAAEAPERPDLGYLQHLLDLRGPAEQPITVRSVVWASRFRTHHRLASVFCSGRIVLIGDAAHVHSPAGGQGMNLGIRDAAALAAPLTAVLDGAPRTVLENWATQRRRRAAGVIALTQRLGGFALVPAPLRRLRDVAIRAAGHVPAVGRRLAYSLAGLADR